MTNFQFLQSEFKPLYEPAKGAEQLVHSDPRASEPLTRKSSVPCRRSQIEAESQVQIVPPLPAFRRRLAASSLRSL